MATRSASRVKKDAAVEEIYYRKGDIDFCFLLNRRHHNLRVFDYRVGNYQQKRDFFDRIAWSEGLKKVYTVVEKQDSKSWRSVGFSREGAIPGYFRTADAYVMSRVYTDDGEPIAGGAPKLNAPAYKPRKVETTLPKSLTFDVVEDEGVLAKVTRTHEEGALYAPFRREVYRPDLAMKGRVGRREFWVGAETDSSFGHAKIDLLAPADALDKDEAFAIYTAVVEQMIAELAARDTASAFAVVPVDVAPANELFATLGFRVTGRLTDHLVRGSDYVGAQIWHKRVVHTQTPKISVFG